jgi:uncharacterized protein
MNIKLRTVFLMGVFTAPMLAHAASFDCAKAASATEKLICGNPAVSLLDEQLGQAYKQALTNSADKDSLKQQQMEWLKQQRTCKDAECLTKTYQARIEQLKKNEAATNASVQDTKSIDKPQVNASTEKTIHFKLVYGDSYPLCKPYVDMLNATHYTKMPVCERKILPGFNGFRNIDWAEIIDKGEMERVINKMVRIQKAMTSNVNDIDRVLEYKLKKIRNNESKLYFFKWDVNKDGDEEIVYRLVSSKSSVDEGKECQLYKGYYFDDKKITIENANKQFSSPYDMFSTYWDDQLFVFDGSVYNSLWGNGSVTAGSNLDIYGLNSKKICGILAE